MRGANSKGRIKHQPEWVALLATLPSSRRSNIQFQYRIEVPWGAKGINTRKALDIIVDGWVVMKPVVDSLTEPEVGPG